MLTLLIAHIIITVCTFWSGYLFYRIYPGKNESKQFVYFLISGLILVTAMAQIIVLFFPVAMNLQLVFAVLLFLSVLFKWKDFKILLKRNLSGTAAWSPLSLILFSLSWFSILLIAAGPTMMDDTDSYHIQSIKWIQEYGTVPGLVNLHERFGFNSSWFSSVALFNFLPGKIGGFIVLNSVLSMWLCYWFISNFNLFQKENNLRAGFTILLVFICCLLIWPLIRGNAATANYDFIATCIVLILFTDTFLSTKKEITPTIEWIIWPAYLFTIRIINFPLLILSIVAILFFVKEKKLKVTLLSIACCLLLIIPFTVRNIIIAGYPFYPTTYFNWFRVDWKPDPKMTEQLLEYIKYYNRVPTTYLEIKQIKALGPDWIPSWFHYLFIYDKLLVLAGVGGLFFSIVMLFTRNHFYNKKNTLLIVVSIVSLFCWFIISPDPRFVYGILLSGIFLLANHLISFFKNMAILKLISSITVILLIAGTCIYLFSKTIKQKEYRNWLLPLQLPQPPAKETVIDGIIFHIPEPFNNNWNPRCYGTDLPCLYKIHTRLRLRGKNIRDGFHLEK